MPQTRTVISAGVCVLCFAVQYAVAQTASASSPCRASDSEPGWLTFVDRVHGFCFEYPPLYKKEKPVRKPYLRPGSELLGSFVSGQTPRFGQHGEWLAAEILVIFSKEPFDLERIVTYYAPTGVIGFIPVPIGPHTFYYSGPGGGGVQYPDVFFTTLAGKRSGSNSTVTTNATNHQMSRQSKLSAKY